MSKPTSISDLERLGYTVGMASGAVEVEEAAHAAAVGAADPEKLSEQASLTALRLVTEAREGGGRLPPGKTWEDLAAAATVQALRMLTEDKQSAVELHERAVEIARSSPTIYHVEGFGVATYVSVNDETGGGSDDDAQAAIDALADPAAIASRRFLLEAPEAVVEAVAQLRRENVEVESAVLDGKAFSVKVKGAKAATTKAEVAALVKRFVDGGEGQA